jgi:hypothetical protein
MKTSITPSQARTCATGTPWYRNPLWLGLGVVGMLAVVLYASLHFGQAGSYWPYLLLLACPLMHLFMCRGKKQEASSAAPGPVDSAER